MNTIGKIAIGLLGLIFIFGINFIGSVKADSTKDNVDLHIRVEVSTDNGQTWLNTSGTDYSGGQTVQLCQGESFQIRTRIWNTGTQLASQVTGLSSVTNSANISNPGSGSVAVNSNDEDGDGVIFDHVSFTHNGAIYVASVAPNGSYNNGYQGSIVTIQPSNECPTPGTVVFLSGNIQGYTTNSGGQQVQPPPPPLQPVMRLGINSAKATGIGNMSEVRMIPCGCQTSNAGNVKELPQTGADLD